MKRIHWSLYHTSYGVLILFLTIIALVIVIAKLHCHVDLVDPTMSFENIRKHHEHMSSPKEHEDCNHQRMADRIRQQMIEEKRQSDRQIKANERKGVDAIIRGMS